MKKLENLTFSKTLKTIKHLKVRRICKKQTENLKNSKIWNWKTDNLRNSGKRQRIKYGKYKINEKYAKYEEIEKFEIKKKKLKSEIRNICKQKKIEKY